MVLKLQLRRSGRSLGAASVVIVLGTALTIPIPAACAQEPETSPVFSFNGFGTLGVAHSSKENADFTRHSLQEHGAGRSREWSPDVDSMLGAQLSARLTPRFSAVLQVVSEQRHDGSYDPLVDWANIKYQVSPDLAVRAGRIVLPVFMVSDHRKVGYANPWVRPPVELYGLVPLSHSDGMDALYRLRANGVSHTLQFAVGETDSRTPQGGEVRVEDGWLVADKIEYGPLMIHAAYARAKLTLDDYKPLFDGYRRIAQDPQVRAFMPQAAAQAEAVVARYEPDRRRTTFAGIGASYDPGSWFLLAEAGQVSSRSVFGRRAAWYATAGKRWDKFTPYLSYAQAKLRSNSSDPGVNLQAAAPLNARLNASLASAPVQKTISAGIRWDFAASAALKMQFDHSRIGAGSPGTLRNHEPGAPSGGKFNVFSVTLDFVF